MREKSTPEKTGAYLKRLEKLIDKYFGMIEKGENIKIGDLMKMVELHKKLAPSTNEQKKFWEMVDQLRIESLPAKKKSGKIAKGKKK